MMLVRHAYVSLHLQIRVSTEIEARSQPKFEVYPSIHRCYEMT